MRAEGHTKGKNFPAQGQMSSTGEQSEGKRQTCCEKECQRSQRAGRAAARIKADELPVGSLLWKESAAGVYRTSGRNSCIYKTMFLSELFWLREIKEVRAWDAIKQNMKWERSEKYLFWMLAGVK